MYVKDRQVVIDHDLTVGHTYEVVVRAVAADGRIEAAELATRKTITLLGVVRAPMAPSALTATPFLVTIFLSWTNPTDSDFDVTEIWRNTVDVRASATKIAEMRTDSFADNIGASGVTRYYWIRSRNTSGIVSEWNAAAGVAGTTAAIVATDIGDFAVTATKMFTNTIILSGAAWTNNSPSAGYIAWNAHTLVHNGVSYAIAAGNTNQLYVYWVFPEGSYFTSATHLSMGTTGFMVATNVVGVAQLVWNSSANMVIGTAFIADLAVTNAKINDLSAAKINAGVLAVTYTAAKCTDALADQTSANVAAGIAGQGALATKNAVTWATGDIASVPVRLTEDDTPAASGVYITPSYIGFFDLASGTWPVRIKNNAGAGEFYVGEATKYVAYNAAGGLTVRGIITVEAGSNVAAGADVTNAALQAGTTITGGGIILSGGGSIHTINKDGYADTTAGIWLGFEGAAYTLGIGAATKFITWDGTTLTVQGLIQTATSGKRIVLNPADNTLRFHSAAADNVIVIDEGIGGYDFGMSFTGSGIVSLVAADSDACLITPHFISFEDDASGKTLSVGYSGITCYLGSTRFLAYKDTNAVQVVGTQGASVADATDAASVILRLNELLARCRAHGLIATA